MICRHAPLMVLFALCTALLMQAPLPAVGAEPERIKVHARLDGLPDLLFMDEGTDLNSAPKRFIVEFSRPMDRASAQKVFYQHNAKIEHFDPDSSRTMGIRFAWQSDRVLHLEIEKPRGEILVSFEGARGRGKTATVQDSVGSGRFFFQKPQVIRKLDLQGRTLAQYRIPNTILTHVVVQGAGLYATATQMYTGDDVPRGKPVLLELRGSRAALTVISCEKDSFWDDTPLAAWDPAASGVLMRSFRTMALLTLEAIQKGRPARVLIDVGKPGIKNSEGGMLAAAGAPGGQKMATLTLINSPGLGQPGVPVPLGLTVLDRQGQILLHQVLPIRTVLSSIYIYGDVWLEWQDDRFLLAEGRDAQDKNLCHYRVDTRNGILERLGRRPYAQIQNFHQSALPLLEASDRWKNMMEMEAIGGIAAAGPDRLAIERRPSWDETTHTIELYDLATWTPRALGKGFLAGASADAIWVVGQEAQP